MSKSGIVNVRMVITEEKILSNIDKIQKLINPKSKKQIVQLEDDMYFKDLIESIKTYLIEYPKKKNFPISVYKAAYGLVEYSTNQFEENTKKIEVLIRQREQNISLAGDLKELVEKVENKDKDWKDQVKKAEGKYILFLDSDDKIEKHSMQRLVEFFDSHYEEIDLVTYPMKIYANEKAKPTQHYRYQFYKEGTGVYDLVENPYLGQSTINTMIKNLGEQNVLFDKEMTYSEDEAFNTQVLMRKKKIGFLLSSPTAKRSKSTVLISENTFFQVAEAGAIQLECFIQNSDCKGG